MLLAPNSDIHASATVSHYIDGDRNWDSWAQSGTTKNILGITNYGHPNIYIIYIMAITIEGNEVIAMERSIKTLFLTACQANVVYTSRTQVPPTFKRE